MSNANRATRAEDDLCQTNGPWSVRLSYYSREIARFSPAQIRRSQMNAAVFRVSRLLKARNNRSRVNSRHVAARFSRLGTQLIQRYIERVISAQKSRVRAFTPYFAQGEEGSITKMTIIHSYSPKKYHDSRLSIGDLLPYAHIDTRYRFRNARDAYAYTRREIGSARERKDIGT